MIRLDSILRPIALALLLTAPAADTIHRADGEPLEDVVIEDETITTVTYTSASGELQNIPSEKVVRVEFSRPPEEIDRAETAVSDGDLELARSDFRSYLEELLGGRREREKWAGPYAAKRIIELSEALGDTAGVVQAADRLLSSYPESRYVPQAYLAKANGLIAAGKDAEANETLRQFDALIGQKGLSTRWSLECQLALVQTDSSLSGPARRERLQEVVSTAGTSFPGVRHRAELAKAESYVAEAIRTESGRAELLAKAKPIFESIVEDRFAPTEVLAGAHTGIGDCLFYGKGDDDRLMEAGMHYLRVSVLYEDASRYVAKAMFYAGRCFDQLDTPEHKAKARRLYSEVLRLYPGSNWAAEARNFLR